MLISTTVEYIWRYTEAGCEQNIACEFDNVDVGCCCPALPSHRWAGPGLQIFAIIVCGVCSQHRGVAGGGHMEGSWRVANLNRLFSSSLDTLHTIITDSNPKDTIN